MAPWSFAGETQLHVACVKNNVNKIKQLLRTPGEKQFEISRIVNLKQFQNN